MPQSTSAGSQVPQQLLSGQFRGYAHKTEGVATIYDLDGKRVLRLTDFKTSNGPDVHVYLVAAPDARDNATVDNAEFIDLGTMKGNIGDQNYDVPNTADLGKYRAATIWCKRFHINFGTAPLTTKNE
jgi:electron transfer DM13